MKPTLQAGAKTGFAHMPEQRMQFVTTPLPSGEGLGVGRCRATGDGVTTTQDQLYFDLVASSRFDFHPTPNPSPEGRGISTVHVATRTLR